MNEKFLTLFFHKLYQIQLNLNSNIYYAIELYDLLMMKAYNVDSSKIIMPQIMKDAQILVGTYVINIVVNSQHLTVSFF